MTTTDCCTDTRKLIRWSMVLLKPGRERVVVRDREELISSSMSQSEFETWKVAELFQQDPRIPVSDGKYLRVYSEVLRCYEKPAWDFEETQIEVLEEIRNTLRGRSQRHRVRLPRTMRLSGALNADRSEFGDEFINMPDYMGAHPAPGHTFLTGWVEVAFSEPKGDIAEFTLDWYGAGTPVVITFGGGQQFDFSRTRTFPLPFLPNLQPVQSRGQLDLATGKVLPQSVQIFATFQGTTIARTDRVNRIPYAFPYIYPPLDPSQLQIQIPPDYRPPQPMPNVFGDIAFSYDFDGNITGFELHSETFAPVGLFPYIQNFFPPFSFGPKNQFHFALPDRCLLGTPPQSCPNQSDNPDGILTSVNVYFHPHLDLVADEMSAVPRQQAAPASLPADSADAVVVEAGGRLYRIGGARGDEDVSGRVDVYDPARNQWTAGPPLPHPVASAQGAAVGGRIYVFGGWPGAEQPPVGHVQVLDTAAGSWSVLDKAPLPVPVAEGTATAVGDKIYVISGWQQKSNKTKLATAVQIFDTRDRSWSQGAPASLPAAGACAVAVDHEILVIGGRILGDGVTHRTAVYDTRSNQWNIGPDTLVPVYEATGARIEGRVFLVGGRSKVDAPTLPLAQELVLADDQWRPGLPPPLAAASAGAAVLDGALYVVGGRAAGGKGLGTRTQAVQVLQPARAWTSGDLPLFTAANVVSLGGGTGQPQSPGAAALLIGANLAGADPSQVQVTVGGLPAPVVAATPQALFFQMPVDLDPASGKAELRVTRADLPQQAPAVQIPVAAVTPGLFVYDYGEPLEPTFLQHGPSLACNEDGTLNFASQPATPGELLGLWATGLGKDPLSSSLLEDLKAEVGGKPAKVEKVTPPPFPFPVPGVWVVHVRVPDNAQLASNSPALLRYKDFTSNPVAVALRKEAWRLEPPVPCNFPPAFGAVFPFLIPLPGN